MWNSGVHLKPSSPDVMELFHMIPQQIVLGPRGHFGLPYAGAATLGQRSGVCGVTYRADTPCTPWHLSWLTGDIQVGVGVDLPSLVAGEALEDAGVLRPQRVDAQPPAQQHLVPGVLQPAEGNWVLVPHQGGDGNTCSSKKKSLLIFAKRVLGHIPVFPSFYANYFYFCQAALDGGCVSYYQW